MLDSARDLEIRRKMGAAPQLAPAVHTSMMREVYQRCGWRWMYAPRLKAGLGFDEAALLGLFRPEMAGEDFSRFVGKARQKRFHAICNDRRWYALADDKAVFYTMLKGAGLAAPATIAFAGARKRTGMGEWLSSSEALGAFLGAQDRWPLFAKPVDGMYSLGALRLEGVADGSVQVAGEGPVGLADLWAYMSALSQQGYLVQQCLAPSQFALDHFGMTIASVRLLILFSGPEPRIESAVIKIPSGTHVADNFWRSGNMLAALDGEGRIIRVISGKGPAEREVDRHPATGAALVGLSVPDWSGLCSLALTGAALFPAIRTQSWDVALTEGGPHLLEVNFGGDLDLHQMAHRRGALSAGYAAHLKACGVKGV
ncbi:MAG: hypothetical protein JNM20_11735 [Rhizobiales bacterium]|nr:hypothetical protein [Hyphomicrobiales bacterium]